MVIGLYLGMTNFVATQIISALIPRLGCENKQSESVLITSFIFLFCFTNSVVLSQISTSYSLIEWIKVYYPSFYTSMITTSSLPYLMPIVGIIYKWKTKKQAPVFTRIFKIEQKYALYLNTMSMCFYFGGFCPLLFFVAALSFMFQYIFDRLLITYWYEHKSSIDDQLNNAIVIFLKYVPTIIVPSMALILLGQVIQGRSNLEYLWLNFVIFFPGFFGTICVDIYRIFIKD